MHYNTDARIDTVHKYREISENQFALSGMRINRYNNAGSLEERVNYLNYYKPTDSWLYIEVIRHIYTPENNIEKLTVHDSIASTDEEELSYVENFRYDESVHQDQILQHIEARPLEYNTYSGSLAKDHMLLELEYLHPNDFFDQQLNTRIINHYSKNENTSTNS